MAVAAGNALNLRGTSTDTIHTLVETGVNLASGNRLFRDYLGDLRDAENSAAYCEGAFVIPLFFQE